MNIESKAAFETAKALVIWLAAAAGFYFLLDILGPKIGMIFLLVSMVGWFTWLVYDYYVNKFTVEEKFKL